MSNPDIFGLITKVNNLLNLISRWLQLGENILLKYSQLKLMRVKTNEEVSSSKFQFSKIFIRIDRGSY